MVLLVAMSIDAMAQMPGGVSVKVSHKTQVMNGRRFYIHVVEQGQTVYAISRAYGLKEVEAVTKKDVHFLQVGDTVWLPCKGQRLPDGTVAPPAVDPVPTTTPTQGTASHTEGNGQGVSSTAKQDTEPEVLGPTAEIRPRIDPRKVVVSVMMPLNLSQMDKISTSKFDVEQRGKIVYKSLEFIQFYEGLLMGLESLEQRGYDVVVNVVDVEGGSDEVVEAAFRSHHVAESDLLITMLTRQPFEKASKLAQMANLFVVNPVSDRQEIVKGNPYVFKCMPSVEARAKAIVQAIHYSLAGSEVFVIHSGSKAEKNTLQALTAELEREGLHYTLVDWAKAQKLTSMLKNSGRAAVVSIYDQERSKNRIYASQLLNRLASVKSGTPYLFTFDDWTSLYSDIDFSQLQSLNYHTFYGDWQMSDPLQKAFVERFREKFKTEPVSGYAGMANDIVLYFVSGLQQKGTDFFRNPSLSNSPEGVMYPLRFGHSREDWGFENQEAVLYRMRDYQFEVVNPSRR